MLATLIASVVSGEAAEAAQRARRAAIVYVLAGLLGLCGAGFLVGAGYAALAREIGGIDAALWFGGGFLAVALVLVAGHRIVAGLRVRRAAKRRRTEAKAMAGAAALALLPSLLAGKGGRLALIAPALGLLGYAIYREHVQAPSPTDDPANEL